MNKSVANVDRLMERDRELDRQSRHTLKALRILGLKPETFGFRLLGPRSLMLNEHHQAHMLDLTLGLSFGVSDKLTEKAKKNALVELLQSLDQSVVSAISAHRG